MKKTVASLKESGFVHLGRLFDDKELQTITTNIEQYSKKNTDGVVTEIDKRSFRAIHGPHLYEPFFEGIAKHSRLLELARKYLNEAVYVHQFKINLKKAFEGGSWPWHQDYIYWNVWDHIQEPRLVNIAIALDDINMLNGPLCVVPKSHKIGNISEAIIQDNQRRTWEQDVSANLSYQVSKASLAKLLPEFGHQFITCRAGDVFAFDPQIVHSSSNNMSPTDRRIILITYNAMSNAPKIFSKRPEFLCAKNIVKLV